MNWVTKREKVELLVEEDLIPSALEQLVRRAELNGKLTRGVLVKGRRYAKVIVDAFRSDERFNGYEVVKNNEGGVDEGVWYAIDVQDYLGIYLRD